MTQSMSVRGILGVLAFLVVSLMRVNSASAQESMVDETGTCHYIVPSHSVCHENSGECYSRDGHYIGNFLDCGAATPAIASGGRVDPDACGGSCGFCSGHSCTQNSDCCASDFGMVCNDNVCCHSGTAGVGGGCASGPQDCCGDLDCLYISETCAEHVGWSAKVTAPSATDLSNANSRYNSIIASFPVPAAPSNPDDINNNVFWIGVQPSGSVTTPLIQGESWYTSDPTKDDAPGTYFIWSQVIRGGVGTL